MQFFWPHESIGRSEFLTRQITLLTRNQFGYQTDYFNYAKYLSEGIEGAAVVSICLDANQPKVDLPNARVVYVAGSSNMKVIRYLKLVLAGFRSLRAGDTLLVKYFPGFSLLRLSPRRRNIIVDIRTLSVSSDRTKRRIENFICRVEIWRNPRITVISSIVANKLHLSNWSLLPLAADPPRNPDLLAQKDKGGVPIFVYAGTLDGRELPVLLEAFQRISHDMPAKLRIIGTGASKASLQSLTEEMELEEKVHFYGHIPHGDLFSELLSTSTFGLVHVPPTEYYAGQPSTKLYEYWAHGLPVLCSNYPSGAGEIQNGTGEVYEFNPSDLAKCMNQAVRNYTNYDFSLISELASSHTWGKVISRHLIPIL